MPVQDSNDVTHQSVIEAAVIHGLSFGADAPLLAAADDVLGYGLRELRKGRLARTIVWLDSIPMSEIESIAENLRDSNASRLLGLRRSARLA